MKIKVLFLIPSLGRAGAETQLVDLVNGLDKKIFEKTLAIFHENVDQLERVDRGNTQFFQFVRAHKFDVRVVAKLTRLIKQRKPDIIHCTNQFVMLLAWAATRFVHPKPKLVVAIHSTQSIRKIIALYEQTVYRLIMKKVDCILFVCFAQAEYWFRLHSEIRRKSIVVYNGVDTSVFSPSCGAKTTTELRARLNVDESQAIVACVAGLRAEKAHSVLLEAFSRLAGQAHLVLAGDGPLREQLANHAHALGIQERTHFLGNVRDVRPILQIADLTVLPSTTEAFSIAMLESMSMQTPMVATNVGGLREAIVPHQTGYLIEAGDVDGLGMILAEALADKSKLKQMGVNARQLVLEKFSIDVAVARTAAIFTRVMNDQPFLNDEQERQEPP